MTNLHFCLGIMSPLDIINSLNKNKRLLIQYGVLNVTEAFLFDVNIDIVIIECDINLVRMGV